MQVAPTSCLSTQITYRIRISFRPGAGFEVEFHSVLVVNLVISNKSESPLNIMHVRLFVLSEVKVAFVSRKFILF